LGQWIAEARNGSDVALGRLFEACRAYLLLVANDELHSELQAKVGASDLVQDTFLEAHRGFARFHGQSEGDLLAWLRRILLNNLANIHRHYQQTDKRQVSREIALADSALDDLRQAINPPAETPSSQLAAREHDESLQRALARLSQVARQVIEWRNYQRLTFEAIGKRLDKSAEAARKIWARAIVELQWILEPGRKGGD
jgi:RNA polymerase sigma-70 factor (ECF subfamily)